MKKYNHLLSVLLVPAMILQAWGHHHLRRRWRWDNSPDCHFTGVADSALQTFNDFTEFFYNFAVITVSSHWNRIHRGNDLQRMVCQSSWDRPWRRQTSTGTPPTVVAPEDPSNSPTGVATYSTIENTYSISGSGGANSDPRLHLLINLAGVGATPRLS